MRSVVPLLVLPTLVAACGWDIGVYGKEQTTPVPVCDGKKQPDEEYTDAPFDKDGDGFVDGANIDCKATYDPDDLDCNDTNADINPSVLEEPCNGLDDDCSDRTPDAEDEEIVCNGVDDDCNPNTQDAPDLDYDTFDACSDCDDLEPDANPGMDELCDDGIDNDCDDEIDEECVDDYNGAWTLEGPVAYSCAGGLVNVNFSAVQVVDIAPSLTIAVPGSAQPGSMTGSLSGDTFYVSNTLPGTCTETYSLTGTFTSSDTFEATFQASFTGGSLCFDCTSQVWAVYGQRD